MIFRREPIHKKLARQARLDLAPEAGPHPEPVDPGPNWGEVGIHGVSRPRRWDAVGSVEAPDLEGDQLNFVALSSGEIVVDEYDPEGAIAPLAETIDQSLERPYRAEAVRRDGDVWAVAAERIQVAELDVPGEELQLAASGGERTLTSRRRALLWDGPRARAARSEPGTRIRRARAPRGGPSLGGRGQPAVNEPRSRAATLVLPVPARRIREGTSLRRRPPPEAARPSRRRTSASLEPEFEGLSDAELAGKTVEFKQRIENGEPVDEARFFEAFAAVREAFRSHDGGQPVRGAGHGRDRPPRGRHRRDAARAKGKTFVAVQPLYLNALHRPKRAPRHGQRLPRQARSRVGRSPSGTRSGCAPPFIQAQMSFDERTGGLRRRRHVWHQLRVRLRLPARQHGRHARGRGPARPRVRDRGRGRLDPDRRGPHAADHFRRARDRRAGRTTTSRAWSSRWSRSPRSRARKKNAAEASGADYAYDEKHKTVSPLHDRDREGRARRRDRQPLRPAQRPARQPPEPGAQGRSRSTSATSTTSSRTARSRSSTSSPAGSWKAAAGRRACTRRSRARRVCGSRRSPPGGRDDHDPELLPPLRQARRHDRHRQDLGQCRHHLGSIAGPPLRSWLARFRRMRQLSDSDLPRQSRPLSALRSESGLFLLPARPPIVARA